jgi:hypothetical protein
VHEPARGDDGDVLALAMDPRLADLDRLDLVGTSPLMPYSVRCSKKTIGLSS